jgi:hypothetical protein
LSHKHEFRVQTQGLRGGPPSASPLCFFSIPCRKHILILHVFLFLQESRILILPVFHSLQEAHAFGQLEANRRTAADAAAR